MKYPDIQDAGMIDPGTIFLLMFYVLVAGGLVALLGRMAVQEFRNLRATFSLRSWRKRQRASRRRLRE